MTNISRPVRRREDARLVIGRGRFADDVNLPGQAYAAFASHVTTLRLVNNRAVANPLEPRSSLASYDPAADRYALVAATQGMRYMLRVLCEHTFHVPREQMHVLTYDVGGGFEVKEQPYPEDVAILHAARVLGRPVKWQGTRAEHFLSDNHARDIASRSLMMAGSASFSAARR